MTSVYTSNFVSQLSKLMVWHKMWHKSLWNRLQLQFGELQ